MLFFFNINLFILIGGYLQYCIGFAIHQHQFAILNLPPSSLPVPSLWVVPVHQPQTSSIYRFGFLMVLAVTTHAECGREELPHVRGQGRRPGGVTPHPRSGGCTGAGGPRGAILCSRSGGEVVRRYPSSKVRSTGCALLEQP